MNCAVCHKDATDSPHTMRGCDGSRWVDVKVCEECWVALFQQQVGGFSIAGKEVQ